MKFFTLTVLLSIMLFYSCNEAETVGYIVTDNFIPCGWMGCGEQGPDYISLDEHWEDSPHTGKDCFRISFKNCDEIGSGIYWINQQIKGECNWGDVPGTDFSTNNFSKLTFWARGEKGGERIRFGMGGINKSNKLYEDSVNAFKFVNLTDKWEKYTVSLRDQKMHSVIGGFYWYGGKDDNPNGATFFVDDVELE